jgi:hypothetical protein
MVGSAAPMAITEQDVIVIIGFFIPTCAADDVLCCQLLMFIIVVCWNLPVPYHAFALRETLFDTLNISSAELNQQITPRGPFSPYQSIPRSQV